MSENIMCGTPATPSPVDEAKLAQVIHEESCGGNCGCAPMLIDLKVARAVREYLESR